MPASSKKDKLCLQCGKELSSGEQFCSRECKSLSQIKRITLACKGCGKEFSVWPCLKRKTNYCCIKCYWDSTRLKEECTCKRCGKKFLAKSYLIEKGFGLYCGRECQFKNYPAKIEKICPKCGMKFYVQPARAGKTTYCSKKCTDDSKRDYVTRICRKCGQEFGLPRSDTDRGRGNFCTYKCYLTYRGPSTLEEKMERALNLAGIKFEREIKFKRFHVDFLISKIKTVIECDGEYWHLSSKIQDRDKRKEELLKSLGYRVLRFSGKTMDKFSEKQLASNVVSALRFQTKH